MSRATNFLIIFFSVICFNATFADLPKWVPSLKAPESSTVLFERIEVEVKSNKRLVRGKRLIYITEFEDTHNIPLVLRESTFQRVKRGRLWTQERNGTKQVLKKHDSFRGALGRDLSILDDDGLFVLDPDKPALPAWIAHEWELEISNDFNQDVWQFSRDLPMEAFELRIDSRKFEPKIRTSDALTLKKIGENHWTLESIRHPKRSKHLYPDEVKGITVHYPGMGRLDLSSWDNLSLDLAEFFPVTQIDIDTVRSIVEKNQIRTMEDAIQYVRAIRYFGIEIGWGGWVARNPSTTLNRMFGDCKDKSHLLVTILKILDIKAFPVLSISKSTSSVPMELPSWFWFNHCIVAISDPDANPDDPSTLIHPELGVLRLVDPTLPSTYPTDLLRSYSRATLWPITGQSTTPISFDKTDQATKSAFTFTLQNKDEIAIRWTVQGSAKLAWIENEFYEVRKKSILEKLQATWHQSGFRLQLNEESISIDHSADEWIFTANAKIYPGTVTAGNYKLLAIPLGFHGIFLDAWDESGGFDLPHNIVEEHTWVIPNQLFKPLDSPLDLNINNEAGSLSLKTEQEPTLTSYSGTYVLKANINEPSELDAYGELQSALDKYSWIYLKGNLQESK